MHACMQQKQDRSEESMPIGGHMAAPGKPSAAFRLQGEVVASQNERLKSVGGQPFA